MKALDTNALVRFLVADHPGMKAKTDRLLDEAAANRESFGITGYVLLEMLWVLKAVYKFSREDILDAVDKLTAMPVLTFEPSCPVHELVAMARNTNFDLADILIGLAARQQNWETTLTLDKKAAQSELFEEIQSHAPRNEDEENKRKVGDGK